MAEGGEGKGAGLAALMAGKGGKGKGGGYGAPKAAAAPALSEEEKLKMKKEREEKKAVLEKQKAQEKAHTAFLGSLFTAAPASIMKVDWSKVERQVMLVGGTTICRLEDDKVVCVRRPQQGAAEEVGRCLARAIGIKTQISRPVHPDDPEYAKIEEMTARAPLYYDDTPMLWERFMAEMLETAPDGLTSEMKRPLMQFEYTQPDVATTSLGAPAKAKGTVFVEEFLAGAGFHMLCGPIGPEVSKDLGKWGALTGILHQIDKFPLPVWKESGSLRDLMRPMNDPKMMIALELGPVPLTGDELTAYNERLQQMVREELGFPGEKQEWKGYKVEKGQAKKEMMQMLDAGGWECAAKDMDAMTEGFHEGLKAIANAFDNDEIERALSMALEECAKIVPFDDKAHSGAACAEFVRATAGAVSKAAK